MIDRIKGIYEEQEKSVVPLPPSQLDPLDLTGKIAPCCNTQSQCVCEYDHAPRVAMETLSGSLFEITSN